MAIVRVGDWIEDVPKGVNLSLVKRRDPTFPVAFSCRAGACGLCGVEVVEGEENLSPISSIEEKTCARVWHGRKVRLACQCEVNGDVTLKPLYEVDL